MDKIVLFNEKQSFNQKWITLFFIAINGVFVFVFVKQCILGIQLGDKPISNQSVIIPALLFGIFTFLFYQINLMTTITEEGIYFRFRPFHFKYKFYSWDKIAKAYVRKYNPLTDFGGWGIRFGADNMAYNISGNIGLQIEFRDKSKVLIGTKKGYEIETILAKLSAKGIPPN